MENIPAPKERMFAACSTALNAEARQQPWGHTNVLENPVKIHEVKYCITLPVHLQVF